MLHAPALLLAILLAQADPAAAPASQPTLEQLRAEHLQLVEQEFSALPRRDPLPIGKIVSIGIEQGHLHVKPLVDPTSGAVAIDATDWPGRMMITVGDPQSLTFSLKHIDVSKSNEIATYTHVITGADYLQINRDSETATGMSSITLIQSRQFADDNEDPIRLTVHLTPDEPGVAELNAVWSAGNFEQLRRDHPRETQKYLLPILRDFHAAHLLRAGDPGVAWQALAAEAGIDPTLQQKVDQLVEKLNAADFATRAAAEDELTALGAPAAAALARMDLSRLPTDPRATIEAIIRARQSLPASRIKALRNDPDFLLDTLLLDDPILRRAAASRLGDLTGKSIDLPDSLSAEEREKRVETLRAQFAPATQPTPK